MAEKVTKNHKYRPCFKKIDSLCARLKQDISRPDGVLNNLNSQGLAWAVKDLIFVFTRIINAWLILKGYVYNRAEGMEKVQSGFSANFQEGFFQWQKATQSLIENIVESFENLDEAVQKSTHRSHGNHNGTSSSGKKAAAGGRMNNSDLNNFLWENKEVTMRASNKKRGAAANLNATPMSAAGEGGDSLEDQMGRMFAEKSPAVATPVYNEAERDSYETYYKTGLYQSMKRSGGGGGASGLSADSPEFDFRGGEEKENMCSVANVPQPQPEMDLIDKIDLEANLKRYEEETAMKIQYILYRVGMIPEASLFLRALFLKNYVSG